MVPKKLLPVPPKTLTRKRKRRKKRKVIGKLFALHANAIMPGFILKTLHWITKF